jgi:hypothetical protein
MVGIAVIVGVCVGVSVAGAYLVGRRRSRPSLGPVADGQSLQSGLQLSGATPPIVEGDVQRALLDAARARDEAERLRGLVQNDFQTSQPASNGLSEAPTPSWPILVPDGGTTSPVGGAAQRALVDAARQAARVFAFAEVRRLLRGVDDAAARDEALVDAAHQASKVGAFNEVRRFAQLMQDVQVRDKALLDASRYASRVGAFSEVTKLVDLVSPQNREQLR